MAETEKHRDQMIYAITGMQHHFADDPDIYVSGNNFVYWERGNPQAVVSPDCYVVLGVEKRRRDLYKVWEEGATPSVVFEYTSKKTRREDMQKKRRIYQDKLYVDEYFLFDPTADYLNPRLQGNRLVNGVYEPILMVNGRLYSEILGLELVPEGELLRFYDPRRDVWILSPEEQAQRAEAEAQRAEFAAERARIEAQRAEAEARRANEATARADIEAAARQAAETEIERLRAELEALRKPQ